MNTRKQHVTFTASGGPLVLSHQIPASGQESRIRLPLPIPTWRQRASCTLFSCDGTLCQVPQTAPGRLRTVPCFL